MSYNPGALERLVREFCDTEPDARNSGIYAAKSGYHNTRYNHLRGINGGDPDDYSIQLTIDQAGLDSLAAAVDISFDSARLHGRFGTIAKYARRLYDAFRREDPRLYHNGRRVVREFFGQIDTDLDVEGWSLYRERFADSDPSHLWHIHISFHRWAVTNWDAVSGVLDVLLGRPLPTAPEDDVSPEDITRIAKAAAKEMLDADSAPYGGAPGVSIGRYLIGTRQAMDAEKQRDKATDAKLAHLHDEVEDIAEQIATEGA